MFGFRSRAQIIDAMGAAILKGADRRINLVDLQPRNPVTGEVIGKDPEADKRWRDGASSV